MISSSKGLEHYYSIYCWASITFCPSDKLIRTLSKTMSGSTFIPCASEKPQVPFFLLLILWHSTLRTIRLFSAPRETFWTQSSWVVVLSLFFFFPRQCWPNTSFLLNFADIGVHNLGRYFCFSKANEIPWTISSFLKAKASRVNVASQHQKKCWPS